MKYIVLSFDDGRKDFFTRALPVMKKYNFPSTVNIVSDLVGKSDIPEFCSGGGECMSWSDIESSKESNVEIANHSANHKNTVEDIILGGEEISKRLGLSSLPGFASPNSEVCEANFDKFRELLVSGKVKYIRSGNVLRRDGYLYILLFLIYRYTKNFLSFYLYNKRNIISVKNPPKHILPSITCNRDNTMKQLIKFIEKMPDDSASIIMFHSIIIEDDSGFGKDKWFNTVKEFEQLCEFLANNNNVQVVSNEMLCDLLG